MALVLRSSMVYMVDIIKVWCPNRYVLPDTFTGRK
jgi:hypothetical protein